MKEIEKSLELLEKIIGFQKDLSTSIKELKKATRNKSYL